MIHYLFITDPRTAKIILEPNRFNEPVLGVVLGADFHLETVSVLLSFRYRND
jgi:hypothetical protein